MLAVLFLGLVLGFVSGALYCAGETRKTADRDALAEARAGAYERLLRQCEGELSELAPTGEEHTE